jgi:hypothetical protein
LLYSPYYLFELLYLFDFERLVLLVEFLLLSISLFNLTFDHHNIVFLNLVSDLSHRDLGSFEGVCIRQKLKLSFNILDVGDGSELFAVGEMFLLDPQQVPNSPPNDLDRSSDECE